LFHQLTGIAYEQERIEKNKSVKMQPRIEKDVSDQRLSHECLHFALGTVRTTTRADAAADFIPTMYFPFTLEKVNELLDKLQLNRMYIIRFSIHTTEVPGISIEKVKHFFKEVMGEEEKFPSPCLRRGRPGAGRCAATSYWNHYSNEYVCVATSEQE
jgi:hypothetical protein